VNGLSPDLLFRNLFRNPNSMQPVRLGGPGQQVTCDQDHEYSNEQQAFNGGAMDRFVEYTEGNNCDPTSFNPPGLVMTTRRQHGDRVVELRTRYAMSDNFYNTTFGPSARGDQPGSGQTHGVVTKFTPGGGFPTTTSSTTPATLRAP
jgi:phospholipase C